MSTWSPSSEPREDAETSVAVRRHVVVRSVLAVETRLGFVPVLALRVVKEGITIVEKVTCYRCCGNTAETYLLD